MKKAGPNPPREKAPITDEQMAVVKRKVSAPKGSKPAGLSTFKTPKKYMEGEKPDKKDSRSDVDEDEYDEKGEEDEHDLPRKVDARKKKGVKNDDSDEGDHRPKRVDKKKKSNKNRRADRSRSSDEESVDVESYDDDDNDDRALRRRAVGKGKNLHQDSEDSDSSGRRQESRPRGLAQNARNRASRGDSNDRESITRRDRSITPDRGQKAKDRDVRRDGDTSIRQEPTKTRTGNIRSRSDLDDYSKEANKASNSVTRPTSDGKLLDHRGMQKRIPPRTKDEDIVEGPDEESEVTYEENYPRRSITAQFRNPLNGGGPVTNQNVPTKAGVFNFKPILHSTYRELRNFVMTPPPAGLIVRCYIERDRNGSNILAPFYSLCADLEDGTGRELMVCKKVLRSRSAHYVFSLKADDLYRKRENRSRLYLGKLRATNANEYVLFDNGISERGAGDEHDSDDDHGDGDSKSAVGMESQDFRQQMSVIYFNTKTRPVPENLRGMEVCVPVPTLVPRPTHLDGDVGPSQVLSCKAPNIQMPFQQIRDSGRQNDLMANKFFVLHEKQSKYDPLSSCLVDFKGRANIASVKNFQLIESAPETGASFISARLRGTLNEEKDRDIILLQLGKATDQCFNLDFRAPITMLQSFAIAVARFDAKLSW